ncbi:MAG: cbb3-type cytochrome c oxidase subunit II, partial [Acidimicrobiia bacterium]
VVYYLRPRLTGRSGFVPTQLSVIGLWSLGFVWALTAPSDLTYGPGPDWLDTISVIFGVGMAIPVAVIFADMVTAMRGRWHDVSDATSMRYVMAGAVALALIPVVNLMVALRGTSAIVGFTDWLGAVEFLAVGVAATFWLLAYLSVAGPDLGRGGPPSTRWPYLVTVLGAMVFIAGLLLGGLQVGLTWLGGANTPGVVNTGNGFETSAEALQGVYVLRLVGYAIYAYGLVWFMARFVLPGRPDGPPVPADASQPPEIDADLALRVPLRYRKLVVGAVALFGLAVGLALVLPSLEADEATLLAERSRSYADGTAVAEGREVYLREGCHVCHTQVVRPIISDVGLGAVSQQGDYSDETPALIGSLRIGPDLMHVASRVRDDADGGDTAAFVASHLSDPRQLRPWSIMPAYDYLSAEDLGMLVAYIVSLD